MKKTELSIPEFFARPNENNQFRPEVCRYIRAHGPNPIVVDGLFDLLVAETGDNIDKYLELKVRLDSETTSGVEFTDKQHRFISEQIPSTLSPRYRIFIYDHANLEYALCSAEELRSGFRSATGKSVYISQTHLKKNLTWNNPADAYAALLAWLNGRI